MYIHIPNAYVCYNILKFIYSMVKSPAWAPSFSAPRPRKKSGWEFWVLKIRKNGLNEEKVFSIKKVGHSSRILISKLEKLALLFCRQTF